VLFGGASFNDLSDGDIDILSREIPTSSLNKTIIDVLVETGVASSNGEARRLISGGAVSINGEKITDDFMIASKSLIKKGKNGFILVK